MYSLRTITPPTVEPVGLDLFKSHLRIDGNDEDSLLRVYLAGARSNLEALTQRSFMPQQLDFRLDQGICTWFDGRRINLPRPGTLELATITYPDMSGTVQTVDPSNYAVNLSNEPSQVILSSQVQLPFFDPYRFNGIRIAYWAGSYCTSQVFSYTTTPGNPKVALPVPAAGGPVTLVRTDTNQPVPVTIAADNTITTDDSLTGVPLQLSYYGTAVPENVQISVMLLAAHYYANREATGTVPMQEIPLGIKNLVAGEMSYAGNYDLPMVREDLQPVRGYL